MMSEMEGFHCINLLILITAMISSYELHWHCMPCKRYGFPSINRHCKKELCNPSPSTIPSLCLLDTTAHDKSHRPSSWYFHTNYSNQILEIVNWSYTKLTVHSGFATALVLIISAAKCLSAYYLIRKHDLGSTIHHLISVI